MNAQVKKEGFTIIEVVLVLAIAGLIFLMVFIALPALQRNQRDTARKTDVSTVASAYTTYTNNNRGQAPTDVATIDVTTAYASTDNAFKKYLGDLSDNSDTVTVKAYVTGATNPIAATDGQIIVIKQAKCGTAENTVVSGTKRQVAVGTLLEGGGAMFCQDS